MIKIENPAPGKRAEAERRLASHLSSLDRSGLLAQELCQKGALNAINFLLAQEGDLREVATLMQRDLRYAAMAVSEECARRGLPVVQE